MVQNHTTRKEGIAKVRDLIKDIEIAMLTTCCEDGSLHSRPMATQKTDFDGDVWFFTAASSHKAKDIDGNMHVNVAYAAPSSNRFVSLSGTARLVRDKKKMTELWDPTVKAWFPAGLDDPNLALLEVTVESAEYWDGPSSIVYAIDLATSIITGERPDAGEYAKVQMK